MLDPTFYQDYHHFSVTGQDRAHRQEPMVPNSLTHTLLGP